MLKGTKLYIALYSVVITSLVILLLVFFLSRRNPHKRGIREKDRIREEAEDLGISPDALIADVRELYEAFGFDWFYGIPRPWEYEGDIVGIIQAYNRSSYPLLAEAYNNIYRRDLTIDLRQYLSESEIGEIAHIIPL